MKSFGFFLVFSFALSNIHASDNLTIRQDDYKEAFESTQKFNKQTLDGALFGRPEAPPEKNIFSPLNLEVKAQKVRSYFQDVKLLFKKFTIQSAKLSDYLKMSWRSVRGIKSLPPVANGLIYYYNTAGAMPEVMWVPDGANDPDGSIDRFEFDFGDGTSQNIPFADFDAGKTISHIYLTPGTYLASVKIVDNSGDFTIYSNSITVVSNNNMPVPKFTLQKNQVPNFLKVDFESQATDSDGSIIRYAWRFGDGSPDEVDTANTTATHTYVNPGVYNVLLSVRDNHRAQQYGLTQVYVGQHPPAGGMMPVPFVDANTLAGAAPLVVNFDGEKSFDIDGTVASYEWNFGDYTNPRNISYLSKPEYRYTQPGTYYGSLKVTDNGGRSNTRFFAVYVLAANNNPRPAEIIAVPTATSRTFFFDSDYQNIHAPVPSYYQIWDFGDSTPKVKGANVSHTYANDGTYTVTLKVYDVRGGFQQIQKSLTVNSNQSAPNVFFLASSNNTKINTQISFVTQNPATVSPTTTAIWDFGDGARYTGLHKDLLTAYYTYTKKGLYPVSLTVTDINGKSAQFTRYVVVQDTVLPIQATIMASAKSGLIPFPVRLDAGESTSSAGIITKYDWNIQSVGITERDQRKVITPIYSTGGERYVSLFVEDSGGNIGLAFETIAAIDPALVPVNNQKPVSILGMHFITTGNSSIIKFNGFSSFDPDGDRIVSYEWNFDGTPVSTDPVFTLTSVGAEDHRIVLRVTDRWGAFHEQKIVFKNPNVDFNSTPIKPVVNLPVYFIADSQTITLPNSQVAFQEWDFGDGSAVVYGSQQTHSYTSTGTYTVKLTVYDNFGRSYERCHDLIVENAMAPAIVITAQDERYLYEAFGNQTLTWNYFPGEILFDLERSSVQGMGLVDAIWNFGDGNTGFGLNPSNRYQKPGSYTVSVTATDRQGTTGTSTMQVVITDLYCSETDGVNGCLKLNNSIGQVLPMNSSEWSIGHDAGNQNWNPVVGDTDFAYLEVLDQDIPTIYNISSAIDVVGAELKIQKSELQTLGIDFSKPYKLSVSTKLDDNSNYFGEFPRIYFGMGTVNIATNEENIRLTITGANGYKKYIDLGNSTTFQLTNLPVDQYLVHAEKGNRNLGYTFSILNSSPTALAIDLTSRNIEKQEEEIEKEKKRQRNLPKALSVWGQSPKDNIGIKHGDYPAWSHDYCGNHPPYKISEGRPPPPKGMIYADAFSSTFNSIQPNHPLSKAYGKELKISCAFQAGLNAYSVGKWQYFYGPQRCYGGNPGPASYWTYLKETLDAQGLRPATLKWTIKDAVTGAEVTGAYKTTMNELIIKNGTTKDNITTKVGMANGTPIEHWGLKLEHLIPIPKEFIRPELTLKFDSYYNNTGGERDYYVTCDIEKEIAKYPRVVELEPMPLTTSKDIVQQYTPEFNGVQFLEHDLFPLDKETGLTIPPYFNLTNIYKAKFYVHFKAGNFLPGQINRMKVKLKYQGVLKGSKEYEVDPEKIMATKDAETFKIPVEINANDFASMIPYSRGINRGIELEFLPLGPEITEDDVAEYVYQLTPMFSARLQGQSICKSFYNGEPNVNRISTFGVPELLDALAEKSETLETRCNDFSLPWGGPFPPHTKGHRRGREADVRYFNTSTTTQDAYDGGIAAQRLNDVNLYLLLSKWAKDVAELPGFVIKKNELFNFCKTGNNGGPLNPCALTTQIDDLTHLKILQICQWHDTTESLCGPGLSGYRGAIVRYSTWSEFNVNALFQLTPDLGILMSAGQSLPFIDPGLDLDPGSLNWQRLGINNGTWPDGNPLYKITTNISDQRIHSCHTNGGCGFGALFKFDDEFHFDHMHISKGKK